MSNGSLDRSGCITFNGTSTFANGSSLTIVTDYQVAMIANSTLTMTNGNLAMSINMQATPSVMELSGLMVNSNATIQTNGTGQTTIEARGGNGVSSTVQNLYQNKGVAVINGGKIIGGTTGSLSITGYSYNNLTFSASNKINGQGVFVYSNVTANGMSTITSRGANVVVTGYGANDITANTMAPGLSTSSITNAGVVVGGPTFTTANDTGGLITSGGNGTVTVRGYGGSLADQPTIDTSSSNAYAKSIGVLVTGGNATITSGGAGLVSVTGFGGGATANTICGTGVAVYSGNINSGANGSVFVNGTGFMNGTQKEQVGVYLFGTGCISTGPGTGDVTVTGQGGGTGNIAGFNYGVYLQFGGNITAGGSGNVTVTGRGGLSQSTNNKGILMSGGGAITSNGGDVLVTGYGGTGNAATSTGTFTHGVEITTNSRITAGGLGDVTVAGYGGNQNGTGGTQNYGVSMTSFGSSQLPSFITSGGGNVSVLGVGGGGNADSTATRPMACNTGVCIACGSYVTVGGTGNVTVTGQGGNRSPGASGSNNYGVYVGDGNRTVYSAGNMAYSFISSSGGLVTVNGSGGGGMANTGSSTSGNNYGVIVEKAGTITSGGNADVNLTGTGGSFGNSSSSGGGSYGVSVTGTMLPTNAPVPYRSTVTSGGSGNVTIIGNGGGSGSGSVNVGILVSTGALVTAGGASSSVTLSGQGGNTTGVQNFGVCITAVSNTFPATVTSNGGNVSITGCGPLATAGSAQYGIYLFTNGTVSSGGNGSVTLTGRGGTGDVGTSGSGHVGVILETNATISSGGTGPVLINGYGGGSGARAGNYGVHLKGASVIRGGDTATVTVNGYGGNTNGNGTTNAGVYLTGANTKITSSNGPVQITGIGGQTNTTVSGSNTNYGVYVESGAEASSTGTAPITVNGTGGGLGTGSASTNHGVFLQSLGTGNTTPKIASAGGLVTVTGTAGGLNGNGSVNDGVRIGAGGLITSTGSGTAVSITGIGGGGSNATATNTGIYMAGCTTVSNFTITANGGNIFLYGTEGTGSGSVGVGACTTVASVIGNSSTPGAITIVTNSANLATTIGSAINSSSNITFLPRTAGVGATLGCTTDTPSGPLTLSAAELATLNAGNIQIGNSTTGNYNIAGPVTIPAASNLTLLSNTTASIQSTATSGTGITMGAGKVLNVASLASLNTAINGTTAQTNYNQLNVVGDLSLTGKSLNLSGSYTPVSGNIFTIVNASNLTGTFTGLADGSTMTFKTRTLILNYTPTAVTLTEPSPLVTLQPTGNTVVSGSTASFTATATGIPSPSVQWQVSSDGTNWSNIANETSPTYSFTTAKSDNTKQYHAVFTNTYGNATTSAANLTVQFAPSITTQPANSTINDGQTATFTAAATGNPTPTVQWQVDTGSGWADVTDGTGSTTTTYTTGALPAAASGYQYRARFTNSITANVDTNAATVTVNSGTSAPTITTQPSNQTATAGNTATFTAAASGAPTPTVQWQSSPDGTNWTDIALATSNIYTTPTLVSGDNGKQYRAVYTNGVGSDATTSAAILTVNYAPSITTQPSNQTISDGATATFTAAATGRPAPTVQWQVNTGSGWANVSTGTGGTTDSYTTAALTTAASGYQYRALFTNSVTANVPTNAATVTVNAGATAPTVTGQPSTIGVEVGQTASFTAAASGSPTPTVQWQVKIGAANWTDIGGATSATYSFTAALADQGNQYRAVFNNTAGTATTNPATLNLGVTPVITSINYMTIPVGLTSGITVIATGSPAPQYSIVSGNLPSGVTLDPVTGLFSGTPASDTAGSYPVTIQALNGIGTAPTQSFTLTVTSTITSFVVSKGVAQRSYIRYLDLGMDSNASALALLQNPGRVQLTKADLNGVGSTNVPLGGFLSVPTGQSTLAINFGTVGLGNSRNTNTADGYYTLGVDLDGNGTFETNLFFFRILGDTNGDREVTVADQNAVLAGCSLPYNANLDLNGDGVVNTSDFQYVKKSVGKKLKNTLIVTA